MHLTSMSLFVLLCQTAHPLQFLLLLVEQPNHISMKNNYIYKDLSVFSAPCILSPKVHEFALKNFIGEATLLLHQMMLYKLAKNLDRQFVK